MLVCIIQNWQSYNLMAMYTHGFIVETQPVYNVVTMMEPSIVFWPRNIVAECFTCLVRHAMCSLSNVILVDEKVHFIPSTSEILSQMWYQCVQYTRCHPLSLISHCYMAQCCTPTKSVLNIINDAWGRENKLDQVCRDISQISETEHLSCFWHNDKWQSFATDLQTLATLFLNSLWASSNKKL